MSASDSAGQSGVRGQTRGVGAAVAGRGPLVIIMDLDARLHVKILEDIKLFLEGQGIRDINNEQTHMIWNMQKQSMSVGNIIRRGYYLGSNVSYNVKKMVENGYLTHQRSNADRRSFLIKPTDKGEELTDKLAVFLQGQIAASMEDTVITADDIGKTTETLRQLARFYQYTTGQAPKVV